MLDNTFAGLDAASLNPCYTPQVITAPYQSSTLLTHTKAARSATRLRYTMAIGNRTSLRLTLPLLYRNYDIRYINPINDFALHSKPVYYYAKAALRLDSHHRGPTALHNAIPLQSETTQDRAIPAHHIALLCHTTASHSLAKRHLAIAPLTRAKRNLAIPLHYIPDNTSAYHSMTIVCQTIPRHDSRMHHMTSQNR